MPSSRRVDVNGREWPLLQQDICDFRNQCRSLKAPAVQSAGKLQEAGAKEGAITIVDITNEADASKLEQAMSGAHALVIATSGVPEMKEPPKEGQPPNFGWKGDQLPEQVCIL